MSLYDRIALRDDFAVAMRNWLKATNPRMSGYWHREMNRLMRLLGPSAPVTATVTPRYPAASRVFGRRNRVSA